MENNFFYLKGIEITHSFIFEKAPGYMGNEGRFKLVFKYDGDEIRERGVYKKDSGVYGTSSNSRTKLCPVSCNRNDYYEIAKIIDLTRNLNMSPDYLLKGVIADASCMIYAYDTQGRKGKGLYINKLFVNPSDLMERVFAE